MCALVINERFAVQLHVACKGAGWDSAHLMASAIALGTFFAGLDVPVMAAKDLAAEHGDAMNIEHKFSVDNNGNVCKLLKGLKADSASCIRQGDVKDAAFMGTLPYVDMLWMSPPCDDVSTNGKEQGVAGGTGSCMQMVVDNYIAKNKPQRVCVEQVAGVLRNKHKNILKDYKNSMRKLGYKMFAKVCSAIDTGSCQDRQRWICVACLETSQKREFQWPETERWTGKLKFKKLQCAEPLDKNLPPKDLNKGRPRQNVKAAISKLLALKGKKEIAGNKTKKSCRVNKHSRWATIASSKFTVNHLIVDVGSTLKYLSFRVGVWPTVTRTRALSKAYWIMQQGRRPTMKELAFAFDLDADFVDKCLELVSESRFGFMLGNSIPKSMARFALVAAFNVTLPATLKGTTTL